MLVMESFEASVVNDGICNGRNHSDHYSKERKCTYSCTPATSLLVDDRESTKKAVERTIWGLLATFATKWDAVYEQMIAK